jgi:type I restriction enzyme S subunit
VDKKTFLENFGVIAEAPNGIQQLREIVLSLAMKGKLVNAKPGKEQNIQCDLEALRLDASRLWGHDYIADSPNHWSVIPMARLGKWGSGGTPKKGNADYYGGTIPWLVIGDLNDGLVESASSMITQKAVDESSATLIPKGAVLIAMYGSIGKAGITSIACTTNQAIAHCLPDEKVISAKYMLQLVLGLRSRLFTQARGLAQQNISQTVLKHLMLSVPPISEQEKIVAKVDELMALCDELEAEKTKQEALRSAARDSAIDAISVSTTPEELSAAWSRISNNWEVVCDSSKSVDRLRSLIVSLGVSGRLADCSESSGDVSSLIKSMAESKATALSELRRADKDFIQHESPRILDFPQYWAQGYLGEFCLVVMGNSPPGDSYRDTEGDGVPLINGPVEFSANPLGNTLKTKFTTSPTYMCKQNDMLVCVRGATTGRTNIAGFDACIGRGVALVRAWESQSFVNLIMWNVGAQLLAAGKGTTFPSISYQDIAGLHVGIPPLAEQERIVAKVSELLGYCDQIEGQLRLRSEIESRFAGASSQLQTI